MRCFWDDRQRRWSGLRHSNRSFWSSPRAPILLPATRSANFELQTRDYAPMARRIASLGLPTLVVMEGGYATEALGANVREFLGGF